MIIRRFFLLLVVVVSFTTHLTATHVVAGEITYEQTGSLTIRITITTYTNSHSVVDREGLEIDWGDGTKEILPRVNGKGVLIENDIVKNLYIHDHTYSSPGEYIVSMTDPHRNGGILNVNFPNSIRVTFHLSTVITLLDDIDKFSNHSPVLLQPPVDVGCIDKPYFHNPNPYDIDGDSLSFEWAVPLQSAGNPVPHFLSPDEIEPGPDNKIILNEETGDIVWKSPQKSGQYNIAIRINEYRCGQMISSITRDMSIIILDCNDDPPEINTTEKVCITAGNLLEIPVVINDSNKDTQLIGFSAYGGPLIQDISPAILSSGILFESVPRTSDFIWQTTCDHIRPDDYTVVFKATDDYFTDTSGLSNLKSVRINVSGPAPAKPQLEQFTHYNKISWPDSYKCQDNPAFRGYTIWRSEGNKVVPNVSCPPDLPDYGYSKIGFSPGNSSLEFQDTNIKEGLTYCYLLTARFDQTNSGTSACTSVESQASEKICTTRDTLLPLITRASVMVTDPAEGVIRVEWSGPDRRNDPIINTGSYAMTLYFSNTATGEFIPIPESTVSNLSSNQLFKKFIFIHRNINTVDAQFFYKIQLSSSQKEIGSSEMASTISLKANPQDSKVILNWHSLTPWQNYNYTIDRMNNGQWQKTGYSKSATFIDTTVQNGKEQCYRIESIGTFPLSSIPDTTLNLSQKVCVIPRPPQSLCKPELTVYQNCKSHTGV